ncbi:TIGR03084 family metal-binding protein [Pseudonocardia sp. CA-142604]|uniref:TIGR03084 family metal-binding protein n=1 Tax=Pseudonocardia sp. CA-142604 TaxID=3240024 RepID=UPI003D91E64A
MPVSMTALADDLTAESAELRGLLAGLDESGWRRDTPAEGWTIADQVSHLAYFDDVAVQSAVDPGAFRAELERMRAAGGVDPDAVAARYRDLSGAELLRWFDRSRERLVETFRGLEPGLRVPWFGPAMSAASSLTARIMETWAHGQDVADTLGVAREPSVRLRHVAHIGVGARAFSYAVHGRVMPDIPVRVELDAPDGSLWTWGPEDAADRITGPAQDFALLITQRRHRDDLALTATGPAALEWAEIGQAFAGTAGKGREPGQFREAARPTSAGEESA